MNGTILSSLYNISFISILLITDNQLSGTLPTNIGLTLPNLQFFEISMNKFFGPIAISICNASQLQMFEIAYNNFMGSVPTNLGNLQDLVVLSLAGVRTYMFHILRTYVMILCNWLIF